MEGIAAKVMRALLCLVAATTLALQAGRGG